MARDSLTALVALNRFGFGARGGASGDFVNAASDPRGFVKVELSRPNSALLEVPGLQPTPVLAKAIFEYQFEVQQARAAAKAGAAAPKENSPDAKSPQRNLSLSDLAQQMAPKDAMQAAGKSGAPANAETMTPTAAPSKPAPPQLNVIQKTFRS